MSEPIATSNFKVELTQLVLAALRDRVHPGRVVANLIEAGDIVILGAQLGGCELLEHLTVIGGQPQGHLH